MERKMKLSLLTALLYVWTIEKDIILYYYMSVYHTMAHVMR